MLNDTCQWLITGYEAEVVHLECRNCRRAEVVDYAIALDAVDGLRELVERAVAVGPLPPESATAAGRDISPKEGMSMRDDHNHCARCGRIIQSHEMLKRAFGGNDKFLYTDLRIVYICADCDYREYLRAIGVGLAVIQIVGWFWGKCYRVLKWAFGK